MRRAAVGGKFTPCPRFNASDPGPSSLPVTAAEIATATARIVAAVKVEMATFTYGMLVAPALLPGEGEPGHTAVGICCDKDPFKPPPPNYTCDCTGVAAYAGSNGAYGHVEQCEGGGEGGDGRAGA